MHTFAQKPKATQQTLSAKSTLSSRGTLGQSPELRSILHSQRTIGNQAVQRMLQTHAEELEGGLASTASSPFGHDYSQIPTHPPAAGAIQTKFATNKPGDEYEQEADRVSDQVMRMPEPQRQRACPCGGGCSKCQTNQPSQEHERLQTKRVQASDTGRIAAPPSVHAVLAVPGQPLDPAIRGFMEPRFGHDFSQVRVHADVAAERSAQDLNARAYTAGHNIVFGADGFTPSTQEGRRLIAHELTHVVQQSAIEGITPGQRNEIRGPHHVSQQAERLCTNRAVQGTARLSVQRKPDDKTTVPIAPKPAPPKPSPQKGLNRTLYVIHNDIWNKLPPAVRFSAEQELKNLFSFVGASSSEKPFSIKVVTASQLPEQFDFSESVVAVIRGDTDTYVTDAFARQDEQIKRWLAEQKVQMPATSPGGKAPFRPDRIGTGGASRSPGTTFALLVMAGAVNIDEVIDSFFDNIEALLENQLTALPKRGRDLTKWPPIVHSKHEAVIWDPLVMLGVALAHAIAHEARHEYVGAGHSKEGLGEEDAPIIGDRSTAQFSTADRKAILDKIHNLEGTQGKATVVPTFPQSMRKKPEQFPF